ncbi:PP2C family protein-serine/threonine phosphatase [Embleya scabrispora]|uniref:PP2C family protein-serine/threonine phosphatase n=1 Tax=Embleya scabrispora TaxID=159449 RepID=UPI00039D97A0|nr:SpoIIE family protein phosphatase [Embleya scabrispora]MYS84763.1 SpoIIE family protein phosphatase [Streptomyces sp. SID5474]
MKSLSNGAATAGGLLRASRHAVLEDLPGLIAEYARPQGFARPLIYLVDVQQQLLRLLPGRDADEGVGDEAPEAELRVDATLAGRAFQSAEPVESPTGADDDDEPREARTRRLWLPLADGAERLGVLGLETDDVDDGAVDRALDLALLVGLLLVSKRAYSDSYERLVRTRPMGLAAEMQWTLMPPGSFAGEQATVSAALEPAYEMGGDAYEYAVDGDTAHLAVFDAMGHDTSAGLTVALALAGCRSSRRHGVGLVRTSEAIEAALLEQFGRSRYATAIIAELDLLTGLLTWVNRGHHPPVLVRNGQWVATLERPPAHPMGTDMGLPVALYEEQLEPGDWLLLYTDGVTEARNPQSEVFGLDRFVDFVIRHIADGLPAPETLRRLIRALREYHQDQLQDDATILLLQWHGGAHT